MFLWAVRENPKEWKHLCPLCILEPCEEPRLQFPVEGLGLAELTGFRAGLRLHSFRALLPAAVPPYNSMVSAI